MSAASVFKESRQPPLEGKRILVVEDNGHTALLVKQTLLAAGAAEIIIALDVEEGLRLLPGFRPDVIVTDLRMPGLDGLDLVRVVRQAALEPNAGVPDPTIPIVLVSAFASRSSVRVARQAGIDAFVIKPFSIDSLVKRVDRAGRRTAEFIIGPGYIGPDRRTPGQRRDARKRAMDLEASPPPPPAIDTLAAQPLRVVASDEAPTGEASPSLLKALYERIRELEDERAAEGV